MTSFCQLWRGVIHAILASCSANPFQLFAFVTNRSWLRLLGWLVWYCQGCIGAVMNFFRIHFIPKVRVFHYIIAAKYEIWESKLKVQGSWKPDFSKVIFLNYSIKEKENGLLVMQELCHLSKCVLLESSPHIMIPSLFPTFPPKSWPPRHFIWNNSPSADSLFSRGGTGRESAAQFSRPV